MKVTNKYGTQVDFDAAVALMDDEIREQLHAEGIETEQAFFTAYEAAHEQKFGREWELSRENPTF